MNYSERAYFDGEPVAHCAARDEFMRLARSRVSAIRMAIAERNSI